MFCTGCDGQVLCRARASWDQVMAGSSGNFHRTWSAGHNGCDRPMTGPISFLMRMWLTSVLQWWTSIQVSCLSARVRWVFAKVGRINEIWHRWLKHIWTLLGALIEPTVVRKWLEFNTTSDWVYGSYRLVPSIIIIIIINIIILK